MYIIVVLVILLFLTQPDYSFFTSKRVRSDIDNTYYRVVKKYDNQKEAADYIARMNIFAEKVIQTLKKHYSRSPATPEQIKGYQILGILEERYAGDALMENSPTSKHDTSYVQNKGEVIALCIREKDTQKNNFHSEDILKFVLLHELAHIVTPELEHSALFWANFKFLLEFCERERLYKSPNFGQKNANYCGMTITYNPLYDASVASYI